MWGQNIEKLFIPAVLFELIEQDESTGSALLLILGANSLCNVRPLFAILLQNVDKCFVLPM